jgi:hypothetical protein
MMERAALGRSALTKCKGRSKGMSGAPEIHDVLPEDADELAGKLEEIKNQFFTTVSNEFRAPLALMPGPIEDELAEQERRFSASTPTTNFRAPGSGWPRRTAWRVGMAAASG